MTQPHVHQSRRVAARKSGGAFVAECATCKWFVDSGMKTRDRAAARRHVEQTGHTVRVEVTRVSYYEAVESA